MTKLAAPLAIAIALGGGFAFQAPAEAQNRGVLEVVVFGNDPCPRSSNDEIVVCARRPEAERYRIPEKFRSAGPRQTGQSWAVRAKSLETVSDTGTFSCSAVGPGGYTGCLEQLIKQSTNERGETNASSQPPE